MNHKTTVDIHSRVIEILDAISQPAAPFYEGGVKNAILSILNQLPENPKLQISEDRFGNLIASFWNARGPELPHLALASHMDHPGFEPMEIHQRRIKAKILGNLPTGQELLGTPVEMHVANQTHLTVIVDFFDEKKEFVWMDLPDHFGGELTNAFAVFAMDRFRLDEPFIHGRAMDDLVGCAIQTATFERVVQEKPEIDFSVIYHRAEEVGFIGAVGACEFGSIPRHALVISLEASKTLEGATPGDGIVIRTGDRLFLFDPNAQALLEKASDALEVQGVLTQKRRMEGGVCEASCYHAFGYETSAIAVPLINYHNRGDQSIAAETVHAADLNAGVELLLQAAFILPRMNRISKIAFNAAVRKKFTENLSRIANEKRF